MGTKEDNKEKLYVILESVDSGIVLKGLGEPIILSVEKFKSMLENSNVIYDLIESEYISLQLNNLPVLVEIL